MPTHPLASVQIGSKSIDIHGFSGEVMESQKWTTTQISGGGGGGYSHNGTGFSSSAPVTSRTTTHDQIFVRAATGEERAMALADVHLAARKGQWLTLLLAISAGRNEGPCVALFNHNTGALDWVTPAVNDTCGPRFYNGLIALAVVSAIFGLFGAFSGGFFSFLIGAGWVGLSVGVIRWILNRRKQFKAEIAALTAQIKRGHGPAQAA